MHSRGWLAGAWVALVVAACGGSSSEHTNEGTAESGVCIAAATARTPPVAAACAAGAPSGCMVGAPELGSDAINALFAANDAAKMDALAKAKLTIAPQPNESTGYIGGAPDLGKSVPASGASYPYYVPGTVYQITKNGMTAAYVAGTSGCDWGKDLFVTDAAGKMGRLVLDPCVTEVQTTRSCLECGPVGTCETVAYDHGIAACDARNGQALYKLDAPGSYVGDVKITYAVKRFVVTTTCTGVSLAP
jgi:hypothetical protein